MSNFDKVAESLKPQTDREKRKLAFRQQKRTGNIERVVCRHCGKEFRPSRFWAEFCSSKCRYRYHNEARKHGEEKSETS